MSNASIYKTQLGDEYLKSYPKRIRKTYSIHLVGSDCKKQPKNTTDIKKVTCKRCLAWIGVKK